MDQAVSAAVEIAQGKLQGVARDGVLRFNGIPYAKPPIESLRWRMPEPAVILLYLGVTTAIAFQALSDHVAIWMYAIAGTLFVVQTCYGAGVLSRVFSWRPLRRIGNVSYSLFLVHTVPIFFVVYVFGPRWFASSGLWPALLGACIAFAAALVLAGALFLIAERPYFAAQQRKHA